MEARLAEKKGERMESFKMIHDYKHNDAYRASFNQLAKLVFGIDFDPWYNAGYWDDNYVCFSYLDDDKVVANVSISRLNMTVKGKPQRAIQVSTVMTHPDYRGKGLAGRLVRAALEHNAGTYDLAYLFANPSVLEFYPRFGFKRVQQNQFSAEVLQLSPAVTQPRKLDLSSPADLETLLRLTNQRVPVSQTIGVSDDQWLLMFYCTMVFGRHLHYLPELDAAVIYRQEDNVLHLIDIFSTKPFDVDEIIGAILPAGVKTIKFHFTPEGTKLDVLCEDWQSEDGLFILPAGFKLPERFMFPTLSQA